jgi:hypothetical protein
MDTLSPDAIKDFLPIIFERSNAAQSLWNFYVVVALGIAGFIASAPKKVVTARIRLLVVAAFAAFVVLNLPALIAVTRERLVLIAAIDAALAKSPLLPMREVIDTSVLPIWGVLAVHGVADIAVLIGIWLL